MRTSSSSSLFERGIAGGYTSLFDFAARVRPHRDELEQLILCGALDSLHANRRQLLWAIPDAMRYADSAAALDGTLLTLSELPPPPLGPEVDDFDVRRKALYERAILEMDVHRHLMSFERERVRAKGGITAAEASRMPFGERGFVVGHPIRLRFPPTASGRRVLFFDLEDETGLLNVTCFDETYQRYGHAVVCRPYVTVQGVSQDRDGHVAFLAEKVFHYTPKATTALPSEGLPIPIADFLMK